MAWPPPAGGVAQRQFAHHLDGHHEIQVLCIPSDEGRRDAYESTLLVEEASATRAVRDRRRRLDRDQALRTVAPQCRHDA